MRQMEAKRQAAARKLQEEKKQSAEADKALELERAREYQRQEELRQQQSAQIEALRVKAVQQQQRATAKVELKHYSSSSTRYGSGNLEVTKPIFRLLFRRYSELNAWECFT